MSKSEREWREYCKALKLNPLNKRVLKNKYYLEGFEVWKKINGEYRYCNYMRYNT